MEARGFECGAYGGRRPIQLMVWASIHKRGAGIGMHQPEKHPECCGLASPVWAYESRDGSVRHIETEIVHGCDVAESLGQSAN
jgi:hypothetical protein